MNQEQAEMQKQLLKELQGDYGFQEDLLLNKISQEYLALVTKIFNAESGGVIFSLDTSEVYECFVFNQDQGDLKEVTFPLPQNRLLQQVLVSGSPFFSNSITTEDLKDCILTKYFSSIPVNIACISLEAQDLPFGTFFLLNKRTPWSPEDIELLKPFASCLGEQLLNTAIFSKQLKTLSEINSRSMNIKELDETLEFLLAKACEHLKADLGLIVLGKEREEKPLLIAIAGDYNLRNRIRIGPKDGLLDCIVTSTGKPLRVNSDYLKQVALPPRVLKEVEEERIKSLLAVPLQAGKTTKGALAVCRRSEVPFQETDVTLLSLFSRQVPFIIYNACTAKENFLNPRLERDFEQRLIQILLEGKGLEEATRAIAEWVASPVVIFDRFLQVRTFSSPPLVDFEEDVLISATGKILQYLKYNSFQGEKRVRLNGLENNRICSPYSAIVSSLAAKGETLGYLIIIETTTRLFNLDNIRQWASILSFELFREKTAYEINRELETNFFNCLFGKGEKSEKELMVRAGYYGYDLSKPYFLVVFELKEREEKQRREFFNCLQSEVTKNFSGSICLEKEGLFLGLLRFFENSRQSHQSLALKFTQEFLKKANEKFGPLSVALGGLCTKIADYPLLFSQAKKALALNKATPHPTPIIFADNLGSLGLLYELRDHKALASFVQEELGPLIAYEEKYHSGFLETLQVFLETGGAFKETAALLHTHVNTIRYRLQRIEEILEVNLKEAKKRFELQLAFHALWLISGGKADESPV